MYISHDVTLFDGLIPLGFSIPYWQTHKGLLHRYRLNTNKYMANVDQIENMMTSNMEDLFLI